MRYYQYGKYPIEFVLSENIDKYFESHNHVGHYVVTAVMQGTAAVRLENRERLCHAGDVFIVPPYAVHSVRQGKDARLLSMCIGTAFIEETDCRTAEGIVREVLEDAVEQGIFEKACKEKWLSCVRMIFSAKDKGGNRVDADIKILTDRITSHPECELPVERLAADIFVSKYYFIKKFKKCVGITPHQFCIQNRIRKAQRLLGTERTVGEISAEMGFYDQSHFDRAFRRIVGISPSEYIRSKTVM